MSKAASYFCMMVVIACSPFWAVRYQLWTSPTNVLYASGLWPTLEAIDRVGVFLSMGFSVILAFLIKSKVSVHQSLSWSALAVSSGLFLLPVVIYCLLFVIFAISGISV